MTYGLIANDDVNYPETTVGRREKTESLDSRDCVGACVRQFTAFSFRGRTEKRINCDPSLDRASDRSFD